MDSVISRYSDENVSLHHSVTDSTDRYNFYLHSHDRCELTFLISGRVSAVIGGKTYKLRKNDLLILRPNTVHGIRVDSGEDYERYNITFDDKNIVDNAFDDIPMGVDVINYSSNHYVTDLFEKLDFYCKNFSGARARALISNVVEELVCNMTLHTHNKTESDKTLLNPLLISAIEYIDESFTNPICIEDICKELYVSKSHLHELFVSNLHISPKKYINLKRLSYAQRLMKKGKKPSEVYSVCGFSDYAVFYRNYKNYFGHSPSDELCGNAVEEIIV